jgi:hypothetical protein
MKSKKEFNQYNLTASQDPSWAVHLPAMSAFYVHQLSKLDGEPDRYGKNRLNPLFDKGHKGLNYYASDGYFEYKWGLYSAGHAKLDLAKSSTMEQMVRNREKDTFMLGDSGGFQLARNAGHFKNVDWAKFRSTEGDSIREQVLRWLEETSDYAMTLDVPGFAADPPFSAKTGLTSFQDALDLSVLNLHYFIKNRQPGKTKFLNVLSGSTTTNAKQWYDEVIKFSDSAKIEEMGYTKDRTLEGYAFAGINMKHMPSVLSRMSDLIKDNMLADKEWIHFLGIGRLDWACYLTSIQRQLRKHHAKNIGISFDCASAFLSVAKGQVYCTPSYTPKRFGYNMRKAVDNKNLKGSQLAMPFDSPISNRMKLGDVCQMGPGEANRLGKVAKTSWDNLSYMLLMAHNVYTHIKAVQEANKLMDYELNAHSLSYKDWSKSKKSSAANEVSDFVPASILFFNSFAEDFFDLRHTAEDRELMIKDNYAFLESISFGGKGGNAFGSLFDLQEESFDNAEDIDSISSYDQDSVLDDLDD